MANKIPAIIKLPGYGVNGTDIHVAVERITHFYSIEYNGRSGTCVVLDTGKELHTELAPYEVHQRIENAI